MGVSVVSKGQDRLAGNIRQNISEFASAAGGEPEAKTPGSVFTTISCTISTEPEMDTVISFMG
jgi:hypothetical protein